MSPVNRTLSQAGIEWNTVESKESGNWWMGLAQRVKGFFVREGSSQKMVSSGFNTTSSAIYNLLHTTSDRQRQRKTFICHPSPTELWARLSNTCSAPRSEANVQSHWKHAGCPQRKKEMASGSFTTMLTFSPWDKRFQPPILDAACRPG